MCQISVDEKKLFKGLRLKIIISLEVRLIRTLILVEISLGKESYLAGFEGQL